MKSKSLLLSIFFLSLIFGCVSSPPPTNKIIAKQENLKTEQSQARSVIPETKVVGKVNNVIVKEIRTTTLGNRMLVDFVMKNDRGRRDVVNYRFRWLDANGIAVTQYDPWETIALEGQEESVLSVSSPVESAVDFRIELKSNQ